MIARKINNQIKVDSLLKIIILFTCISLHSCAKEDDLTPLEKLPPATQTGEQTFGCLINGEVFIPSKIGGNAPRAFYQFARGAYTLGISASSGRGSELISISIGALDINSIGEGTYHLIERESRNYFGSYIKGGGDLWLSTSEDNFGELIITKYDPENYIISGKFSFTVAADDGRKFEITNGRFDLNYTN